MLTWNNIEKLGGSKTYHETKMFHFENTSIFKNILETTYKNYHEGFLKILAKLLTFQKTKLTLQFLVSADNG